MRLRGNLKEVKTQYPTALQVEDYEGMSFRELWFRYVSSLYQNSHNFHWEFPLFTVQVCVCFVCHEDTSHPRWESLKYKELTEQLRQPRRQDNTPVTVLGGWVCPLLSNFSDIFDGELILFTV